MVIPQFGMIIRLLRYHWFYKLELLVVYYMTVFVVQCSHFHFLNVLLVLCSLHISISPISSLAFNVGLHVESRNTTWNISIILLAHCDLLSFLDGSRVGLSKVKGKPLRNDMKRIQEVFKMQTFFYTYRSKMR
jgi:hypothetical protein